MFLALNIAIHRWIHSWRWGLNFFELSTSSSMGYRVLSSSITNTNL